MNNTPLGYQFPLEIKTLSPVHIGGDETLSPLADYVIDSSNDVRFIDAEKFADAVYKSASTEKYIKTVVESANENKLTVLEDFAWHTLERSIAEFYTDTKLVNKGIGNPIQIDCCIKTNGLPYIPGSTLKGAFRTCLLYNWLVTGNEHDIKLIDGFLNKIQEIDTSTERDSRKKIAKISRAFKDDLEEKMIAKMTRNGKDPFSCVQFSDTTTTGAEKLAAYHLKRISILRGQPDGETPLIKECIMPEALYYTNFKLDFYNNQMLHPDFNIETKEDLFAIINDFSLIVLDFERALFEKEIVDENKLEEFNEYTSELVTEIEKNYKKKGYLRLGFGKMQFYQTIALVLYHHLGSKDRNEQWLDYLRFCNSFKDEKFPKIFPSTRTLTTIGQKPLGWVEIS